MKRIGILTGLCGFFLLVLLSACGGKGANVGTDGVHVDGTDALTNDPKVLRVAVTPTLDCLPLYVAQQEGWFSQEGVDVVLCPYQAQMDQDTALLRQRVDGMTTDSVRAHWLRQNEGVALREVAKTSLGWQLVTAKNARIKMLSQLDDKMLAMTRHSATDMLAQHLVDSAGLAQERVFRIQVNDVGVRLDMMRNGIMDAMLLPEPQATVARLEGNPVLYATDEAGMRLGVIVFREEVMADTLRSQLVERFLKVYTAACDSVSHHPLAYYRDVIAASCHVSPVVADSINQPTTENTQR